METESTEGNELTDDFVSYGNFTFRLSDVDGAYHRTESGKPETIVNFCGYRQAVPDPERRFFDALLKALNSCHLE
jgi:hypothetical protein